MANALFDSARASFLTGALDWSSDTIKACLVRGYTFNAAHDFLDDVTGAGGTVVSTSSAFTGKTTTGGVADASDIVFSEAPAGAAIPAIIIYKDGGTDAERALILYGDTGTGLPVTPDGSDITVVWSDSTTRIFKL